MNDGGSSRYLFVVEKAVTLLLLVYPTLMLTVRGGMNGVFLLTLLLALAAWIVRPAGLNMVKWQSEWNAYFVAMAAMSAAIFISQSYHQNYDAHPHDAASRYWLAIPVFLLLQRLRPSTFSVLQFAFPAAAITGLLLAREVADGRWGIGAVDLIRFGNFELMLGVLSLFSIDWFGRDRRPTRIVKWLGFAAGAAASLASGSRGGWLAIPVFIAIFFYFRITRVSWKTIVTGLISAILVISVAYFASATVHQRVNALANDVAAFGEGNRDTSTGIRWQLYKAAVDVFLQHPIFGVGPEGFAQEMGPMMEAGKITPMAAELGRGEVHNDIMSKAAGMGIFGLLAILAIYFVPMRLFLRATKSASERVKRTGLLGIIFVSGFLVFGLTVEILNLNMSVAFYSFTVAVLLAACYSLRHDEQIAMPKYQPGQI